MKKMNQNKRILLLFFFTLMLLNNRVVAQEDSTKPEPVVKLHYFNDSYKVQYLVLESMLKKGRILTPQNNKSYQIYLDSAASDNLVGKVKTNDKGLAKAIIPPSLKPQWDNSSQHTFIVMAGDEEIISDYAISKSRITIDTATTDGVRNITATVVKMENNEWVPVPDVEMKLGIKRLNSILPAGDDPTYTTDSTGVVTVAITKDSLPGDQKGNLVLAANVEDNDQLGNLLVEKTVPWGISVKADNNFFNHRTLWSTRFRTPYWLLMMAYSIIIGVWGTLIYLVFQLVKIGKLGKETVAGPSSLDLVNKDELIETV